VPLGIETGRFSRSKRDEALRTSLLAACGVPPEGKLLLAVGRLHPEKRHKTMIEGFLRARQVRPDLGLVIIGDGPLRTVVEARVRRAGGVHMTGAISDRERLAACMASGDILLHGSGAETYGLVVAEAIASGLAIVSPDSGGAADLAHRGLSRVYPTGDVAGCATAILELVGVLESEVRGPAPEPPGTAESHFAALFDLYQDLIDDRRTTARPAPRPTLAKTPTSA